MGRNIANYHGLRSAEAVASSADAADGVGLLSVPWAAVGARALGRVCMWATVALLLLFTVVCDVSAQCAGRCEVNSYDPGASCQCDEACVRYGDCCRDRDLVCAPSVTHLRITIGTGGDDLRCNSDAVAYLDYDTASGVRRRTSKNMNNNKAWGGYTEKQVTMTLPTGVKLSRLVEFGISFQSGQCNIFDTGDNWNMDSLELIAITEDGAEILLFSQSGTPLHRFMSAAQNTWETPL